MTGLVATPQIRARITVADAVRAQGRAIVKA